MAPARRELILVCSSNGQDIRFSPGQREINTPTDYQVFEKYFLEIRQKVGRQMFVKVIINETESLYECKSAHLRQYSKELVTLNIITDSSQNLTLTKSDSQVYFMNNEGKTVDFYRWA